jgi:hypothetical protein
MGEPGAANINAAFAIALCDEAGPGETDPSSFWHILNA